MEEQIYQNKDFTIESALALEKCSKLLLKNATLLNLNKDFGAKGTSTHFHPDYSVKSEKTKINIEKNVKRMLDDLYDIDRNLFIKFAYRVNLLRDEFLENEVLTQEKIIRHLKVDNLS